MTDTIKSNEDLEVWQSAIELCLQIYELAGHVPSSERFELSSQMRRSAVSVPSNVAEGQRSLERRLEQMKLGLTLAAFAGCLGFGAIFGALLR